MKRILAIAIAASALLLSGCSQVGAAATVGDTKITQAQVQSTVDSILAARVGVDTSQMQLETGEALTRGQLRFFVLTELLQATAKDLKISVSKAEIDTRRASIIEQVGGAASLPTALVGAGIAKDNLDRYIEAISLSDKIGQAVTATGVAQADIGTAVQKLIVDKAAKLGVTINPRYGKWDATVADVVATDPASSAVTPSTK
ncbi:MAG: hypothetical protein F2949_04890 [Actinobacteria bacterium]|uniref:Unannotated protein n=1 Tax=freshwater metagenome TaxID=449393 RepID=A0A6J6WNH3_9ZZZZ|nr:hypothetical protein [Actinomycetota bacterium]MTA72795.1 hypothetical protein [Actinomycetota bacterium]MTB29948.1 hypothetical protein [Actinomycetota bacterium]